MHTHMCVSGGKTFVFWKIWRALFPWNTRFEIRPFALLPKRYPVNANKSWARYTFFERCSFRWHGSRHELLVIFVKYARNYFIFIFFWSFFSNKCLSNRFFFKYCSFILHATIIKLILALFQWRLFMSAVF